jgi:hypothetical protein
MLGGVKAAARCLDFILRPPWTGRGSFARSRFSESNSETKPTPTR